MWATILASKHPQCHRYETSEFFFSTPCAYWPCKDSFTEPYFTHEHLGTEKYEVLICHFDGTNPSEQSAGLQNSILRHFFCLEICLTGSPILVSISRGYVMVVSSSPNYNLSEDYGRSTRKDSLAHVVVAFPNVN